VLEAYDAYWQASVAAQRGDPDPQLFSGSTGDALVELELKVARSSQEGGVVREGAPTITAVDVEITGEEALVFSCVDHSTWLMPGAGGTPPGVVPTTLRMEQVDGAWLVMENVESDPSRTC